MNVARRDSRGGVWFSQSTPVPDGAVYYLPPASGGDARATTALEVSGPDNVELDPPARLWIAGALRSEIVVLDLDSGVARSVFRIATPRSEELILEVERRLQAGTPILDLLGPDLGEPAPGSITGLILSPDGGPVYVTNLGNALIRLER